MSSDSRSMASRAPEWQSRFFLLCYQLSTLLLAGLRLNIPVAGS